MVKLKYKTGATTTTKTYRELRLVEVPENERVQSTTLRRRRIDHLLAIWRVWLLTITTESDTNDVLSLVDFWNAEQRWIQQPYAVADTNWIEVTTQGGRCPLTFVDDVLDWPEVSLELFAKEAS